MNKIISIFLAFFALQLASYAMMDDFLADEIDKKNLEKPPVNVNYNYEDTYFIPIELKITKKISTKNKDIYEGKKLSFVVEKTVFYKGKALVKEGDIIEGRIKFIISSGMNGIPYTLVLDDFKIPNIDQNKLKSQYEKSGFNRTAFVLPLKWALTPLPPSGSLTNFISGGHAKITYRDKISIRYYPNWR